ncbi:MAG: hemolysin family protein [Bacteroidota bacterium]
MILTLAILFLLLSGFFSGTEIAFYSSNRLRVELKRKKGSRQGKLLASYFEDPQRFQTTMLIGNSIALVCFGLLAEDILEGPIGEWGFLQIKNEALKQFLVLLLITIFTTIVVLIFGEYLPKLLFLLNPAGILFWLAYPIAVVWFLLYFIVSVMVRISVWMLGMKEEGSGLVFNRGDLKHFIEFTKPDNQEEIDKELFENALHLSDLKVRECMIPRTEVMGMEISEGVEGLREQFNDTGFSRILIYRESLDEILGYVHHLQLLHRPETIDDIQIIEMPIVPEVYSARDLMNQLIKRKVNIALVVDEFGGTAGICSLEDILEEIVGDIEDEHDAEDLIEEELGESRYRFSGRLEIDDLNEKYNLNLPEDEQYHTLSGYIVTITENIPELGDQIVIGEYEFTVVAMTKTRIKTVEMEKLKDNVTD